jgi:hypothetical protein
MAYNVTTDEVRYRLLSLTSADVSDTVLNSAAFLPAADAWINDKIGADTIAGSSLTANQQAMAKAAEIAYCCAIVVASAPVRGSKAGPIEIKPIPSEDKAKIVAMLQTEYNRYLRLLGLDVDDEHSGGFAFATSGGDDYAPDETDESSVDLADEDTAFNQFG